MTRDTECVFAYFLHSQDKCSCYLRDLLITKGCCICKITFVLNCKSCERIERFFSLCYKSNIYQYDEGYVVSQQRRKILRYWLNVIKCWTFYCIGRTHTEVEAITSNRTCILDNKISQYVKYLQLLNILIHVVFLFTFCT